MGFWGESAKNLASPVCSLYLLIQEQPQIYPAFDLASVKWEPATGPRQLTWVPGPAPGWLKRQGGGEVPDHPTTMPRFQYPQQPKASQSHSIVLRIRCDPISTGMSGIVAGGGILRVFLVLKSEKNSFVFVSSFMLPIVLWHWLTFLMIFSLMCMISSPKTANHDLPSYFTAVLLKLEPRVECRFPCGSERPIVVSWLQQ